MFYQTVDLKADLKNVTAAAYKSQNLFIGGEKGDISLLKLADNGKANFVWNIKIGGKISSLTTTEQGVLVTSFDNFVYLINQNNGKKIWKKRLSGRLLFKPLVIESEKLLVVVENDTAYFIGLENSKLLNRITLPAGEYFTNTPVLLSGRYIFQTNSGLISFSDSDKDCS